VARRSEYIEAMNVPSMNLKTSYFKDMGATTVPLKTCIRNKALN
jgi:hypothetical protein